MSEFIKEDRYIVLKINDILKYLGSNSLAVLDEMADEIDRGRGKDGKRDMECVVIESDWSVFNEAWGLVNKEWERDQRGREEGSVIPNEGYTGPTVSLALWRYSALVKDQNKLNKLYDAGVANWEGYDKAVEDMNDPANI